VFDWLSFWRRRPQTAVKSLTAPEPTPHSRPLTADIVRAQVFMHRNVKHEVGGNYCAPLDHPTNILDLRSAWAGRWALEMAHEFPAATVIALATTPPDPMLALGDGLDALPPNVEFRQDDLTGPLPFPDQSFDLVSWRMLFSILPADMWPTLLAECVRVLRPGGWLEGMEQLPFPRGQREGIATIIGWNSEVMRRDGKDPLIAVKLPRLFAEAGLQDVAERDVFSMDLNEQRRERIRATGMRYIETSKRAVLEHGLATPGEYDRVAEAARQEFLGQFVAPGLKTTDVIGRKPL
jgi:SAM-dependent methyltransferase